MKLTNDMDLKKTNDMEQAEMQETELEQVSGGRLRHADSEIGEIDTILFKESGSWDSLWMDNAMKM